MGTWAEWARDHPIFLGFTNKSRLEPTQNFVKSIFSILPNIPAITTTDKKYFIPITGSNFNCEIPELRVRRGLWDARGLRGPNDTFRQFSGRGHVPIQICHF